MNNGRTLFFGKALPNADEDSIAECDRLIRMINTSLDVTETEAGVTNRRHTEFDVTSVVDDACELIETVAEEKGITLTTQLDNACLFTGDFNCIQRMVANVLDNAVKYTPSGGKIYVSMALENNLLNLDFMDNGVGLDEADYDNIFNRFYRINPSRASNGCGWA